jgi:oxygen-independent coproporphyrinogen-3 oxidase
LYLHIPFCKQACYYCDFHFSTNQSVKKALVSCLSEELIMQKHYLPAGLETIYYGGGTPSLLTPDELGLLQRTIHDHYDTHHVVETTLEANPDDLSLSSLRSLKDSGINRLSIGIQSFDEATLTFLHRSHSSKAAYRSVELARAAGFTNISIDLIFAIPGQPITTLKKSVEAALQLAPEHLSAYSLTIEDRTVFGNWYSKGKLTKVPDETAASEMELLVQLLTDAGYEQYEVSNFCKPGFHSKHNSAYWLDKPYLGVGPSAHSFNLQSRQFNVCNNHEYMRSIQSGKLPTTLEQLSRKDRINERLLTGLRTRWGCDIKELSDRFGYDIRARHYSYLDKLVTEQLAEWDGLNLKLTRKGFLVADRIASDLFVD